MEAAMYDEEKEIEAMKCRLLLKFTESQEKMGSNLDKLMTGFEEIKAMLRKQMGLPQQEGSSANNLGFSLAETCDSPQRSHGLNVEVVCDSFQGSTANKFGNPQDEFQPEKGVVVPGIAGNFQRSSIFHQQAPISTHNHHVSSISEIDSTIIYGSKIDARKHEDEGQQPKLDLSSAVPTSVPAKTTSDSTAFCYSSLMVTEPLSFPLRATLNPTETPPPEPPDRVAVPPPSLNPSLSVTTTKGIVAAQYTSSSSDLFPVALLPTEASKVDFSHTSTLKSIVQHASLWFPIIASVSGTSLATSIVNMGAKADKVRNRTLIHNQVDSLLMLPRLTQVCDDYTLLNPNDPKIAEEDLVVRWISRKMWINLYNCLETTLSKCCLCYNPHEESEQMPFDWKILVGGINNRRYAIALFWLGMMYFRLGHPKLILEPLMELICEYQQPLFVLLNGPFWRAKNLAMALSGFNAQRSKARKVMLDGSGISEEVVDRLQVTIQEKFATFGDKGHPVINILLAEFDLYEFFAFKHLKEKKEVKLVFCEEFSKRTESWNLFNPHRLPLSEQPTLAMIISIATIATVEPWFLLNGITHSFPDLGSTKLWKYKLEAIISVIVLVNGVNQWIKSKIVNFVSVVQPFADMFALRRVAFLRFPAAIDALNTEFDNICPLSYDMPWVLVHTVRLVTGRVDFEVEILDKFQTELLQFYLSKKFVNDPMLGEQMRQQWAIQYNISLNASLREWEWPGNFMVVITLNVVIYHGEIGAAAASQIENPPNLVISQMFHVPRLKICTTLVFVTAHFLPMPSLPVLKWENSMAIFHRKTIDRGRIHVAPVLLKWNTLPPKHGTWKYSSLRTRMLEGEGIVTGYFTYMVLLLLFVSSRMGGGNSNAILLYIET